MATAVTVEIDTGGTKDYISIASAISDDFDTGTGGGGSGGGLTGVDMVSNDEALSVACICTDGNADTAQWTDLTGLITDVTRDVVVQVTGIYRHGGKYPASGNFYRLESPGDSALIISTNYVTIDGVPVKGTGTSDYQATGFSISGTNVTIRGCIIYESASHESYGIHFSASGVDATIMNNLIYNFANGGRAISLLSSSGTTVVDNNTIYGCATAIHRGGAGTVTPSNNITWDCTDDYSGTMTSALNNAYSEGTDPGSGGIDISLESAADVFNNAAGGDYHLSSNPANPCRGAGVNLYSAGVTKDIDGENRPFSGPFDIGADHFTNKAGMFLCF